MMNSIPPELLDHLFGKMNPYQLYCCSMVCKDWCQLIKSNKLLVEKVQKISYDIKDTCRNCRNPALYKCGCNRVKYCSQTCRVADWNYHQHRCIAAGKKFKWSPGTFIDYTVRYDPKRYIEPQMKLNEKHISNKIDIEGVIIEVGVYSDQIDVSMLNDHARFWNEFSVTFKAENVVTIVSKNRFRCHLAVFNSIILKMYNYKQLYDSAPFQLALSLLSI